MTDQPRKRITIDPPNGATILAARHLDATEGPVQVGATVDTATRSAITTVLRHIAKAHNSPTAPTEGRTRYARLDPEARALVDDFDAPDLAEMLVSKKNDIAACNAQQWPQRLAAAEAQLTAVADLIADHEGDEWAAHPATAALRGILDGVRMRITTNAVEATPDFTTPLAGRIEVRDPCPFCESSPALIPRVLMDEHVATVHPEVREGGPGIPVPDAESVIVCTTACDEQHTYDWTCEQFAGIDNGEQPGRTTPDNPASSSDIAEQLRTAIESEMYEYRERTMWWPETGGITEEIARLATRGGLEALQLRLAVLAEYENAITWGTDCLSCARVLDSSIRETERAEKAEAEVARVASLYEQWVKAGPPPLGVPMSRWWDRRLVELRGAIHATAAGVDTQPVHIGGRANAEDCPACTGTNPPYPFICPGPDTEQPRRTTVNNPPKEQS